MDDMKNRLVVEVNNGQSAAFELLTDEDGRHGLRHTLIGASGVPVRCDFVDEGDLISLINWYIYQKENGNPNLIF